MLENRFRYAIEFFTSAGTSLGQVPVDVDWEPALECARFEYLRRAPGVQGHARAAATVHPAWSGEAGEPHVDGFAIEMGSSGKPRESFLFSLSYFKPLVSRSVSRFVEAGKLSVGERFQYVVLAFPETRRPSLPAAPFEVEELPSNLPIHDTEWTPRGDEWNSLGAIVAGDLDTFVPTAVLEEIAMQARAAGEHETGGFLIGHLCRDRKSSDLFASVTGQLPAEHALSESTRLTFTASTWTAVRSTLGLRNRGEILLGWFHSHPCFSWCRECPVENRKTCRTTKDFFSEHDHLLHRTAFSQAYTLALVANVTGEGTDRNVSFSTFGWRQGTVQLKGIYVNSDSFVNHIQGDGYVESSISGNR